MIHFDGVSSIDLELAPYGVALAARRSARDSAVTAARDFATKSVERTLALVAAAIALFANAREFISDGTSYAIITALAVIAAAALAIAWLVDTH